MLTLTTVTDDLIVTLTKDVITGHCDDQRVDRSGDMESQIIFRNNSFQ